MFERFTDRARRVIVLAQEEAPFNNKPMTYFYTGVFNVFF